MAEIDDGFSDIAPYAPPRINAIDDGFLDHAPEGRPPPESKGFLEQTLTPFTSYPATYSQMNRESREQIGEGIEQMGEGFWAPQHSLNMPVPVDNPAALDVLKGAGKTALGGIGFVASPGAAALRTIVGQPVENVTGIPKEYTEFAASLALPLPKRIPALPNVASKVDRAEHMAQLFDAADEAYEAARASKVQWSPQDILQFRGDVTGALKESGHRDFTAPKTFRALEELSSTDPSSAGDVIAVRKTLSKIAKKSPDESDAAVTALGKIDDLLSVIPEANVARGNYAAAKRAETINEAMERAELNAATAGSGQNIDNTTRQAVKSILQSPKLRRGFSQEELMQMAQISRGTFVGNASRYLGNLLGGGGGIGTTISAGAGAYALGPMGAAAPVLGFGFKKLANALTARQVGVLDELMRSRSPMAQAKVANPLIAWSNAAQAFEVSPVPRNLARLSIASRNLSNNFNDVGVTVSPDNILRSIISSVRGEQQQETAQ